MATTAGSASGIAATARLTAVRNISAGGSPRSNPATNTIAQIPSTAQASRAPKRASRFCSGVFTSCALSSRRAMRPSSVSMPGGDDETDAAAVGHQRALAGHVGTVAQRQPGIGQGFGALLHGLRFAGERRLGAHAAAPLR